MKHFDASGTDGKLLNCLTCEREIPEDTWFARIKLGERRVVFCRPGCVENFLDDAIRFARRIEPEPDPTLQTESKRLACEPRIPRPILRFPLSMPEPVGPQ